MERLALPSSFVGARGIRCASDIGRHEQKARHKIKQRREARKPAELARLASFERGRSGSHGSAPRRIRKPPSTARRLPRGRSRRSRQARGRVASGREPAQKSRLSARPTRRPRSTPREGSVSLAQLASDTSETVRGILGGAAAKAAQTVLTSDCLARMTTLASDTERKKTGATDYIVLFYRLELVSALGCRSIAPAAHGASHPVSGAACRAYAISVRATT
jgi:hypothetical protein